MKKINKLKAQIRALTLKLKNGETKNLYALSGKIEQLKSQLKIEEDNYNWENFLSR
jgi:hypothetical protein